MTFGLNVSPAACIWVPLMRRARDRLQRLADLFSRFAADALAAATNRGERATKPGFAPPSRRGGRHHARDVWRDVYRGAAASEASLPASHSSAAECCVRWGAAMAGERCGFAECAA
ncbi:hypothetical protein K4L06_17540 [Lysobacter sp. BMK333-48F3]|uniref:hypothetical protein n=1 Tax=Lysobacter sp. BMK333-48F3 TaxID=2867962 RepID=UPI001C8B92DC|nr:hypothetical protein [Lysobacter sp. BMK333-48F3]MBX9403115.1 hypothetical protein [Lysobacter sp. BMK333-48F3]